MQILNKNFNRNARRYQAGGPMEGAPAEEAPAEAPEGAPAPDQGGQDPLM